MPESYLPRMFNRISSTIKGIGILIRNPWKLNLIINQNEEWEKYVDKHYHLKSLPVVPFDKFTSEASVKPFAFLDGGSLVTDLALLRHLAGTIQHCRYFEIGTWRGESVANVSESAEVCYTLNLPEADLRNYLNNPDYLASQKLFSKNLTNVIHLYGDSMNFNFESPGMKFDLIFIDGDHHYKSIVNDTRKVLRHLCHDDSVVVWHDYGYNPELIRYETMAAILDACPVDLHKYIFHVEHTNCAILYKKQLSTRAFKKYALPDHYFSVNFKILPTNQ